MKRNHEKLLIAALAGLIIAGAAAFAIQPALADKPGVRVATQVAGATYDVLALKLAPSP